MTLATEKINGPRGVGLLFKKREIEISPILFGGGQEKGIRSGTENVAAIAGFAKAFELAETRREKDSKQILNFNYRSCNYRTPFTMRSSPDKSFMILTVEKTFKD